MIDVLDDMCVIRRRLTLAEHVCLSTQRHPFNDAHYYHPLDLPIGSRSSLQSQFHLQPRQIKLLTFMAHHQHPLLPLLTHSPTLRSIAAQHCSYHNTHPCTP